MQNIMKKTAATAVMGGALLFTGGMGFANAAPPQIQEGLVNVAIGDVAVLNDVNANVAAQIAAALCDVADVNAGVIGEAVQGGQSYRCAATNDLGEVVITEAGPGNSENAPGQQNR